MTDDRWRMADGGWRMADGGWRMADGGWRMAHEGWGGIDEGSDRSWEFNRRWIDGSAGGDRAWTWTSEAVAPLVAGAATGLLEHAMVLLGQPAAALAGDLRQDFIEASVKLLLREDRHRRGLRAQAFAGRPARPWRPRPGLIDRHRRDDAQPWPADSRRDQPRPAQVEQLEAECECRTHQVGLVGHSPVVPEQRKDEINSQQHPHRHRQEEEENLTTGIEERVESHHGHHGPGGADQGAIHVAGSGERRDDGPSQGADSSRQEIEHQEVAAPIE